MIKKTMKVLSRNRFILTIILMIQFYLYVVVYVKVGEIEQYSLLMDRDCDYAYENSLGNSSISKEALIIMRNEKDILKDKIADLSYDISINIAYVGGFTIILFSFLFISSRRIAPAI